MIIVSGKAKLSPGALGDIQQEMETVIAQTIRFIEAGEERKLTG